MNIVYKAARYYLPLSVPRAIDLLVIHCAEVRPQPGAAVWLLNYCAQNDRVASWNEAIDDAIITRSVLDKDVAYHAPGVNSRSKGYELATLKMPTAQMWASPYHQKMLTLAEWAFAGDCVLYKIDPFFVDAAGILEGRRGITTHAAVSQAFPAKAGNPPHTDPGPDFPINDFVTRVKRNIDTGNYRKE